jgi:hypothetical protein
MAAMPKTPSRSLMDTSLMVSELRWSSRVVEMTEEIAVVAVERIALVIVAPHLLLTVVVVVVVVVEVDSRLPTIRITVSLLAIFLLVLTGRT